LYIIFNAAFDFGLVNTTYNWLYCNQLTTEIRFMLKHMMFILVHEHGVNRYIRTYTFRIVRVYYRYDFHSPYSSGKLQV